MKPFNCIPLMLDQPTDQTTKIYLAQFTNWTSINFLSQLPNNKSEENETHMSCPATFESGGLTANWQEICACLPCFEMSTLLKETGFFNLELGMDI